MNCEDDTFDTLRRTPFEHAITPSPGHSLDGVMMSILNSTATPSPAWYHRPSSCGWTWEDIKAECGKRLENKSV